MNKTAKSNDAISQALTAAINKSARYLVTYDARIIATFAHEDDAFLLESELADLDRGRGTETGTCEVLDRRGHRLGGYMLTGGKMLVFLRDNEFESHYGKRRK